MKSFLPEDRLEILRAIDTKRKWYSLDDKRVCALCGRVFTGRQIEITPGEPRGYAVRCPTENCSGNERHWYLCEISPARLPDPPLPKTGEFSFMNCEFDGE
ncbi:MAG TPA: hypothetical protein VGG02_12680 [Chthoniobacterales bacterium]|jgi:hypothetical protein